MTATKQSFIYWVTGYMAKSIYTAFLLYQVFLRDVSTLLLGMQILKKNPRQILNSQGEILNHLLILLTKLGP